MRNRTFVLAAVVLLASCGKSPSEKLAQISDEFVNQSLAFSPAAATAAGLHSFQGKKLDEMLDDVSPASLDQQRRFYETSRDRLAGIKPAVLSPEEQADYAILQNQIGLALLDFEKIHSYSHAPQMYVETLGNALFSEFVLEYAPRPERYQQIIARLKKVPLFLDSAATNLISAPDAWAKVAIEENQGNINLVDREIRAQMTTDLADAYDKAARAAVDAMKKFDQYIRNSLSARNNHDWRLGTIYPRKFRLAMAAGVEPDDTLQAAERQVQTVRANMLELAMPLYAKLTPHPDISQLEENERVNLVVGSVLNDFAKHHATPQSFMDAARKDLDEARLFVKEKNLVTLPAQGNLQVIPTPEFLRGIYSVAGFNPAPPLEPQLGAFYWVTPIPADWPADRIESKLREYNDCSLKLITVHEAMPGHYVQFEYANGVQPNSRRILRSLYGNGPYIEGWAQYVTQAMLDEGYLSHSPEAALTLAKQRLRVLGNTILDIRMQMLNMTDEEAMDLMTKQLFQEQEEARGKLQRAKLSSAQLPTYFVGWEAWLKAREDYKKKKGEGFNLTSFHDAALKEGAVPMGVLALLLK